MKNEKLEKERQQGKKMNDKKKQSNNKTMLKNSFFE